MKGYFDSSLLLSILLEQDGKSRAEHTWYQIDGKSSSLLLEAEVRVVLRRYYAETGSEAASRLLQKEARAEEFFRTMTMVPFAGDIMEIIRTEKTLAKCRTLDAIHLATALFLQREAGEPFTICSYDTRMREAARGLGFAVLP